ncbi:MAG: VTT domain-containing protein [Anaerolineales bacterium]|nr:VTT domain-containing protein [Anaerolineales bacterium]
MRESTKTNLIRALALGGVIAISVFVFSVRDQAEELAVFGYPGIFLLALLSNATVLLPAPGLAVVFTMGSVFNPLFVGLAAGAGGTFGELSGYMAGFSGQAVIERADVYARMTKWMSKNGNLTVLLLGLIPNPFFDLTGIAAGALKMPLPRFLFWAWIGITIKMTLFAYLGSSALKWLFEV